MRTIKSHSNLTDQKGYSYICNLKNILSLKNVSNMHYFQNKVQLKVSAYLPQLRTRKRDQKMRIYMTGVYFSVVFVCVCVFCHLTVMPAQGSTNIFSVLFLCRVAKYLNFLLISTTFNSFFFFHLLKWQR